jgi:hypothetical protein
MPKLPLRNPAQQNDAPTLPPAQMPIRQRADMRRHTVTKGKGKGKGIANPDSGPESEADDDAYVIKSNHLNGTLNGGKGKRRILNEFLDDEDEDLYS